LRFSSGFEGDLNEKGLKRLGGGETNDLPGFEGDLNEKGLKRASQFGSKVLPVLKET